MSDSARPASRVVRVFISSTFRDFGAERDLLMKRVFPELRRRARARFVEVIGVDLRWGITEEESEKGETLPICLREIERSRPYFVCLLGERYGWTPAPGQYPELLLEQQPWLREHAGGKSVTELEILHGVLNAPEMAGRAYFYFRDPAFSEGKGADYASEDEDARGKLARLKERIRGSAFPVAGFATPEEVADRITDDLWRLIDAEYPEDAVPDAHERQRRGHEIFAAEKRRNFAGRLSEQAQIRDWLSGEGSLGHSVGCMGHILGASGMGKSSLLCFAVERHRRDFPNDLVFEHFVQATPSACRAAQFLRDLGHFLNGARPLGAAQHFELNHQLSQQQMMQALLARGSQLAQRAGGRFILAIDDVDQMDTSLGEFMPSRSPGGVTIVVTSRTGIVVETTGSIVLEKLAPIETLGLINSILEMHGRRLSASQCKILEAPRSPLHSMLIVNQLGLASGRDELSTTLRELAALGETSEVMEWILCRLEREFGVRAIAGVVEALSVCDYGISELDLCEYAGIGILEWSKLRLAIAEFLLEADGQVRVLNPDVRAAALRRYLPAPVDTAIRRFLDAHPDETKKSLEPSLVATGLIWVRVSDSAPAGCMFHLGAAVRFPDEEVEAVFAPMLASDPGLSLRNERTGNDGDRWVLLAFDPSSVALLDLLERICMLGIEQRFSLQGSGDFDQHIRPEHRDVSIGTCCAVERFSVWYRQLKDPRRVAQLISQVHGSGRSSIQASNEVGAEQLRVAVADLIAHPVHGDFALLSSLLDVPGWDPQVRASYLASAFSRHVARIDEIPPEAIRRCGDSVAASIQYFGYAELVLISETVEAEYWNGESTPEHRRWALERLLVLVEALSVRAQHPRLQQQWKLREVVIRRLLSELILQVDSRRAWKAAWEDIRASALVEQIEVPTRSSLASLVDAHCRALRSDPLAQFGERLLLAQLLSHHHAVPLDAAAIAGVFARLVELRGEGSAACSDSDCWIRSLFNALAESDREMPVLMRLETAWSGLGCRLDDVAASVCTKVEGRTCFDRLSQEERVVLLIRFAEAFRSASSVDRAQEILERSRPLWDFVEARQHGLNQRLSSDSLLDARMRATLASAEIAHEQAPSFRTASAIEALCRRRWQSELDYRAKAECVERACAAWGRVGNPERALAIQEDWVRLLEEHGLRSADTASCIFALAFWRFSASRPLEEAVRAHCIGRRRILVLVGDDSDVGNRLFVEWANETEAWVWCRYWPTLLGQCAVLSVAVVLCRHLACKHACAIWIALLLTFEVVRRLKPQFSLLMHVIAPLLALAIGTWADALVVGCLLVGLRLVSPAVARWWARRLESKVGWTLA